MVSAVVDDKNIVIFINDFYPEYAAAFTKLSKRLGRRLRGIMLIDAERKASGKLLADKDSFFEELVVNFSDDAALTRALRPLEDQLLLVGCESERSQLYFKKVIPHVPYVNTPTESSLDYATDKGKMRELLISFDPTISPKAMVAHDASDTTVTSLCTGLGFPMIVKPTNLAASMLVNKVTSKAELQQVLQRSLHSLDELYTQHRGLGDKTMVIEEFISGDLYSTDVYVDANGKVYVLPFIHFQNGSMVGMDSYQVYQSETYHTLSSVEQARAANVAEKAVHAIGLRSSVAHVELFHAADGWKIVELGARPGGWRQETYQVSYGIDHALNELLVKIGMEPDMPTGIKTHSATFRIHAPQAGTVTAIDGVEAVKNRSDVHTLHIDTKLGDNVLPSTHGGDMLIGGLLHNDDHKQLQNAVDEARANISITIKQD